MRPLSFAPGGFIPDGRSREASRPVSRRAAGTYRGGVRRTRGRGAATAGAPRSEHGAGGPSVGAAGRGCGSHRQPEPRPHLPARRLRCSRARPPTSLTHRTRRVPVAARAVTTDSMSSWRSGWGARRSPATGRPAPYRFPSAASLFASQSAVRSEKVCRAGSRPLRRGDPAFPPSSSGIDGAKASFGGLSFRVGHGSPLPEGGWHVGGDIGLGVVGLTQNIGSGRRHRLVGLRWLRLVDRRSNGPSARCSRSPADRWRPSTTATTTTRGTG